MKFSKRVLIASMDATDIVAADATCDGDASCCGYKEEKLSKHTLVKSASSSNTNINIDLMNHHMQFTLNASGSTSAMTIQIIHPAANPVQKGKNLLNASAHKKAGTATIGW